MKNRTCLLIIALSASAFAASMLSSCAVHTAAYAENESRIQDTAYPTDFIVGTWADVSSSRTQDPAHDETKIYYSIKPGGHGTVAQSSRYPASGHHLYMEADLHWSYLGNNRWRISVPPSSAYRVIENKGVNINNVKGRELTVRYYNEKLYCTGYAKGFQVGIVFVRATMESIAAHARSIRSQPSVLKIRGVTIEE